MSQLITDLLAIRELLSVPERWTKGCAARDALGTSVSPTRDLATCWCIVGALSFCVRDGDRSNAVKDALYRVTEGEGLVHFNERSTHAEILALIDKAIEAERRAA